MVIKFYLRITCSMQIILQESLTRESYKRERNSETKLENSPQTSEENTENFEENSDKNLVQSDETENEKSVNFKQKLISSIL